jgi:hypothetical protein
MRRAALALAFVLYAGTAGAAPAHAKTHAPARTPVVAELYTSQGCSSCVAADKLLDEIANKSGVLGLTLAVDYWDYLGWSDTFAKPEFSARQRAYMQRLSQREVYTPQIVINGVSEAPGADRDKIEAMIRKAQHAKTKPPKMRWLRHGRVQVDAGRAPEDGADVWLVRYDPTARQVVVKRGENRGKTLVQRNVVRQLVRLGGWKGKTRVYAVQASPQGSDALKTCILLQASDGGRILGVLQK